MNSMFQNEILNEFELDAVGGVLSRYRRTGKSLPKVADDEKHRGRLPSLSKIRVNPHSIRCQIKRFATGEERPRCELAGRHNHGIIHGHENLPRMDLDLQLSPIRQVGSPAHPQLSSLTALELKLKLGSDSPHRVSEINRDLLRFPSHGVCAHSPEPNVQRNAQQDKHRRNRQGSSADQLPPLRPRFGDKRGKVDAPDDGPSAVCFVVINQSRGFQAMAAATALPAFSFLPEAARRTGDHGRGWRTSSRHRSGEASLCDRGCTSDNRHFTHSRRLSQPRLRKKQPHARWFKAGRGITLAETLVALTILSFSLLGLAMLFPFEIKMGKLNALSDESAKMAQRELDQIRENAFAASGTFTDMDGNGLDVGCTGPPGTGCGNPLDATGEISFSAAPPVGFSAQLSGATGQLYSVRWNISVTANNGRKIVLAATPINPPTGLASAVQLETLVSP